MGEVYRAHDPRLRRDVALKVLNAALAADPGHVERLAREARAAGGLNHPNILAVFDVGTEGGVAYVVSELLQGQSLRDRLGTGPVPYRKALEYGIQIAQALGAAHEKGIWHRDVKPGNVFIMTDGRVKLLDFGLATRTASNGKADPDDSTASGSAHGAIAGTAGYMSPEQVLGLPVDQRTDLFALGAVLYEMFTGARAFQRSSEMESRNAVLNAEPADPRGLSPRLPDEAVAVLRRCLEKNREERYQSARDLAFQLKQLYQAAEGSRSSSVTRALLGRREAPGLRVLLAVLAAAAGAGATALAIPRIWRPRLPTFEQLTFHRGRIGGARFASEGQAVVYSEARPVESEAGQRNKLEVWRLDLADGPPARPLEIEGADVLAAGPKGLALSLDRRYVGGRRFVGTLATMPISGQGRPREMAKEIEDADWDPAGDALVVARRVGGGGESVLEYPIGRSLFTSAGAIRSPRVSRDGRQIAFLHDPGGVGGGRVAIVDLAGQMTELTAHWPSARGLAWSPAGGEIWFTAAEGRANRSLRAVSLDKRQRLVLQAPASLTLWDIANDGRVLLTRDEERNALVGLAPTWNTERDLSWLDASGVADLSDDGGTLLFGDRFGVYTRRTDGSMPVNLGLKEGFADDLSPDGRVALATSPSMSELLLLPTSEGEPRTLPAYGITSYRGALWCPDGRRIVFNAIDSGRELRSYVQDVSQNPPAAPRRLTTRKDTWVLAISPDGAWAAASQPGKGMSLWPIDGGPPRELVGSQPEDRPVAFSADGESLWVFRRGEVPAQILRVDIRSGRRDVWKTLWPPDPAGVYSIMNFKITPTGHAYFYSYAGVLSQLYLVRGLE